jgi:PAS domain S-box-containing protein
MPKSICERAPSIFIAESESTMRKKQPSPAQLLIPPDRTGRQYSGNAVPEIQQTSVAQSLEQSLGQLQALYQLTAALSRATALEEVYDAALAGLLHALGIDRASILLFDADGVMRFKAWRGLSASYRRATEGHTPWSPDTKDPQPVLVPDVDVEPSLAILQAIISSEGIRALAFVPLVHQGRILGKFMLYYPTPHQFTADEVRLAQNIADHIAVAVARRHAEEALRNSQERLALAYHAANIGTFEWNIQTNAVIWSPEAEAIYGLPQGGFGGSYEHWKQAVHPADRDRADRAVVQTAQTGSDLDAEFRIVWPDGSVHWIAAKGRVYHDQDSTPLRLIGINEDITLRKQVEQRRALQYAVSQVLAEAPTLADAAPRILQVIGESLEWEYGALWTVDQRANVLVCVSTWHISARTFAAFEASTRQRTLGPAIGLPGRIWTQREPIWIADVVVDANFPRAAIARAEGLHTAFGFPIRFERDILGVIEFFSDGIHAPDPDLLQLVAALGTQIGQFMERMQVEEQLRHSEQALTDFFENASVGLHWAGPDGRILRANRAELELLGYTSEEYIGHHIAEFHVDQELIADVLKRLAQNETLRDYEARLRCKDGSIRYVLITSNVLWEDGQFIHTRCFTRDITVRKQAEAALRASEERFRALANVVPTIVWTADPDGTITFANDQWFRYCGLTPEQNARNWPQLVLHPDDQERCRAEWTRALQRGTDYEIEVRNRRYDGEYRWFLTRAVPVRDAEGRITAWFGTTTDIHDRKLAEEERVQLLERERTARGEAQDAVRLRDVFLSVASHELKTPLTSLLGQAQLLLRRARHDGTMREREMHSINVIATQASRLNRMILALLDVSRLETGQLSIERAPLDLGALARQVVAEVQPTLEKHTVTYRGPTVPVIIEGDALRLEQVLQNLVQNAIKYSLQDGYITVQVIQRGAIASVAVIDEGIGIPQDALPRLFSRFYRASNAEAQHIAGMGIGLFVVKEIVSMHGGTVEVESTEGQGSTFTICLPVLEYSDAASKLN